MSNPKPAQDENTGRFLPGNSGNCGRKPGSRSKLGNAFLEALANDFDEHGVATIETVRKRDPVAYIKVVKDVLPKEVLIQAFTEHTNLNIFAGISDIEDAREFASAFALVERAARELVGVEEPAALGCTPEQEDDVEAERCRTQGKYVAPGKPLHRYWGAAG
jgi:hypothetical protein